MKACRAAKLKSSRGSVELVTATAKNSSGACEAFVKDMVTSGAVGIGYGSEDL